MKISNAEAIICAVEAEWVVVSETEFNANRKGKKEMQIGSRNVFYKGIKPFAMECIRTKKYYIENSVYEAMQPKRKEGWYKAKLDGDYGVVKYHQSFGLFKALGCDELKESDFEWVDDKPIEFPGD